jgi:putative colanic acid biosynthesis UDP-glucose lipid carrier transferase
MTDLMLRAGEISGRTLDPAQRRRFRYASGRFMVAAALRIADPFLIAIAAAVAFWLGLADFIRPDVFCLEVVVMMLLTGMFFEAAGLYGRFHADSPPGGTMKLTLVYAAAAAAIIALDGILQQPNRAAHLWIAAGLFLGFALLVGARVAVAELLQALQRSGRLATTVAVVGAGASVERLLARLAFASGPAMVVVEAFDLDNRPCEDVAKALTKAACTRDIDEVLIPLPWSSPTPLDTLLRALGNLSITVRLLPELPNTSFSCLHVGTPCGLPAISVIERPLSDSQMALKRAEDIILSFLALAAFAPVMVLVALLIRLDSPGPVLFRQERWGFNARPISVLKFRTMRLHDDDAVIQATRHDPRVTRIGRILRRTSLDELPQLINVLRGDMSLVGPRPHAVAHNQQYAALIDNYLARHRVKPGITGLAQVNGCRGITDTLDKMERRVAYDLRYIEQWSLLLDVKVLLKTIYVGFVDRNAF